MAALQVHCIYCVNAGCFLRKCQEAKSTKKLKISPEIQKYPRLTVNCIYSFGAIKGSAWECVKMAKLRHAKRRLARELEHAKTLMPKGKMLSFINFWKTWQRTLFVVLYYSNLGCGAILRLLRTPGFLFVADNLACQNSQIGVHNKPISTNLSCVASNSASCGICGCNFSRVRYTRACNVRVTCNALQGEYAKTTVSWCGADLLRALWTLIGETYFDVTTLSARIHPNPDGIRPSRNQQEEETWRKQNSKDWQLCYFVWSSLSAALL